MIPCQVSINLSTSTIPKFIWILSTYFKPILFMRYGKAILDCEFKEIIQSSQKDFEISMWTFPRKVFALKIIAFYLYFVSWEKALHSFLQLPTMHTNWLELKLPNIDPLKLLWTFLFANRLSPLFSLFYVTSLSISIIPSVILFYLCIPVLLRRMQLQRKSKLIKYWAP